MRKYLSLFVIALLFCAVISVGCGGGAAITLTPSRLEI